MSTNAVVIGAGHNGLVAALRLARAGLAVTVVEQGDEPGGCVWTQRRASGVLVERGAFEHAGIRALADDLGLARHGLRYVEHPVVAGFVFGDGQRRVFHADAERTATALGTDASAYLELVERGNALFGMLGTFPEPPTLTGIAAALAPLRGGDELFRTLLMPAETVITSALTDPHLRSALALQASHAQVPAWAPGTGMFAFLLPIAHGAPGVRPVGGSKALVDALVAALTAAGGTVRARCEVTGLSADGSGAAVTLADGETLRADTVVSTLGLPRTAALLRADAPVLRETARSLHSGHFNIAELTVTLVADRPYDLGLEDRDAVWYAVADPDDVRRGFGEVLAGQLPSSPWSMIGEIAQPAGVDGGALWLSSVVPLHPADGPWNPAREHAAADRLIDHVSQILARDLRVGLVETVVSGPATWARRIGGDGSPNHLDNTVDQLLGWRPPGHATARTELDWLFLAGAGQHPGGGLSGASGLAAADAVLGAGGGVPGRSAPRHGGAFGGGLAGGGTVGRLTAEASGLLRGLRAYRSMRNGATR